MKISTAIKSIGLGLVLAATGTARGKEAPEPAASPRPRIEAVFVLDTTGSMRGLIKAAQEKIWSIASTLCQARPAPELEIGLVGYRDRGDQYVTRVTQLSSDLDRVYADLMAFQAQGGGDSPESVNQALHEAVTGIGWSQDNSTYRVIFLVGDCPPHMDYQDDVRYPESCRLAAEQGIVVNTIQCGSHGPTTPIWAEIASLGSGVFFQVEQSGGAVEAATPYDVKLADLSRQLDSTRVFYGTAEVRESQEERVALAGRIYAEAPAAAVAQRAVFNESESGKCNFLGIKELVNDLADGTVSLAEVNDDELPSPLRTMEPAERAAYLNEKAEERGRLQEQIRDLSKKRQDYIREEIVRRAGAGASSSLDHQLYAAISAQAAVKGIKCEGGPVY